MCFSFCFVEFNKLVCFVIVFHFVMFNQHINKIDDQLLKVSREKKIAYRNIAMNINYMTHREKFYIAMNINYVTHHCKRQFIDA